MDRFIRRENVKHYRELLKTARTEAERQKIQNLLDEEEQKQKRAGDKVEENRPLQAAGSSVILMGFLRPRPSETPLRSRAPP
jgi:hypothetical protein